MLTIDLVFEEIIESDIELDDSELVEADSDPPQEMGDSSIEVTDKNREGSQALKEMAVFANLEEKLDEAINFLTKAILLNPKSSMLFASRASVFIKLKKPNAAIRDADAAVKMNADSAKGYKARGIARAQLGLWEEAARDLRMASSLDFDEETVLMLRKVESNAKKIEEHRLKYERLRRENELRKIEHEKKRLLEAEAAAAGIKDGEIIEVPSLSELDVKLNAASKISRLAIIYFTAKWAAPCNLISPIYSRLAGKYPKVVFLKADVNVAMDATDKWEVRSIPRFFFVKKGEVIDRIDEDLDKLVRAKNNLLEQKIAQHLDSIVLLV